MGKNSVAECQPQDYIGTTVPGFANDTTDERKINPCGLIADYEPQNYNEDTAPLKYLRGGSNIAVDPETGLRLVGKDEHFIVWMRTAALPRFRKLWGRIDTDLKEGDKLGFQVSFSSNSLLQVSTNLPAECK